VIETSRTGLTLKKEILKTIEGGLAATLRMLKVLSLPEKGWIFFNDYRISELSSLSCLSLRIKS
jgi:hypothetical protein